MSFINEKVRFHFANLTAVIFLGLVAFSGFAYPLHYGDGFWPFNRDWFMFSYDTGYDFELQALGKYTDGRVEVLDVSPYFRFPVGRHGNRFLETPRDIPSMELLAKFLCRKFPVKSITINDVSWARGVGKPVPLKDVAPSAVTASPWVTDVACGS